MASSPRIPTSEASCLAHVRVIFSTWASVCFGPGCISAFVKVPCHTWHNKSKLWVWKRCLFIYKIYETTYKYIYFGKSHQALREKEKGDWKCLCCEEKKALYRASFCQTFSEFQHPTGQWKVVLGFVLIGTSFAFWCAMFYHYYGETPWTLIYVPRYIPTHILS